MSNMIINTNVLALNSHRAMKNVGSDISKSSEKLSSGMRINRAADDAAGLAISEKMRSQIRGLNQASRNSQDGISLIQTAEGALQETHQMLQRMRELVDQAANDTYTDSDREKIALELNQLTEEIDATAAKTEFNTKKLIDGSWANTSIWLQTGANKNQGLEFNIDAMNASALGVTKNAIGGVVSSTSGSGAAGVKIVADANVFYSGTASPNPDSDTLDFTNINDDFKKNAGNYIINDKSSFEVTTEGKIILKGFEGYADGTEIDPVAIAGGGTAVNFYTTGANTSGGFTVNADGTVAFKTATITPPTAITAPTAVGEKKEISLGNGNVITVTGVADKTDATAVDAANSTYIFRGDSDIYALDAAGKTVAIQKGKEYTTDELKDLFGLGQAGGTQISMVIDGMKVDIDLGDSGASVAAVGATVLGSSSSSGKAIGALTDVVDVAIEKVSLQRAKLGAYQNRLEHTIKNLDVASENLQASESRIRDTDMAAEMVKLTKSNVLSQAAMSMLAQANQAPQAVLQLLR